MPDPLILGFDTSAAHCAAALLSGERLIAAKHEEMVKGQAERLMGLLEDLLAEAGADWSDLDRIGVGVGPGNFTGIRISVAATRGLALSLGIPTIGVSLLEALAFGTDGPVLACLAAPRGQGYFQRFGWGDPSPFMAATDGMPVEPVTRLRCIGNCAAEVAARLGAVHVPAAYAPASAVARLAIGVDARKAGRPKPLYLRPADAQPSRKPPVRILP